MLKTFWCIIDKFQAIYGYFNFLKAGVFET